MASIRSLFNILTTVQIGSYIQVAHCQASDFPFSGSFPTGFSGCVQRFNQLYCVGKNTMKGFEYPTGDIEGYIDDNKALMRRMYGNLVQEDPEPEPVTHRTPASTKPLQSRGVRNFAGRFKRDVLEGFISDLVIGGEDEDDWPTRDSTRDFWSDFVDTNYSDLFTAFNITSPSDQDVFKELVSSAVARPKRQANFPGTTRKENKNLVDVCDSTVEVTTPYWATNSKGKVRAIVNNKQFEQAVHQEICGSSETPRCHRECRCEQKYKWHRLLAYDPNNSACGGIFMDWFLFPSCCTCRCQRNPLIDGPAST